MGTVRFTGRMLCVGLIYHIRMEQETKASWLGRKLWLYSGRHANIHTAEHTHTHTRFHAHTHIVTDICVSGQNLGFYRKFVQQGGLLLFKCNEWMNECINVGWHFILWEWNMTEIRKNGGKWLSYWSVLLLMPYAHNHDSKRHSRFKVDLFHFTYL